MFVRTTKVKRGDKTYRYAQIVKAYRREDGKPRQKVIASLGKLSDLEIENIRLALKAATDGEAVARLCELTERPVVRSSRDYLPIAVVLRISQRIGVTALLERLLDHTNNKVASSRVILALVAHRLVAPGSKIAAVRWFKRTALPELLDVKAAELNNSRLHRALTALDEVRPELQLGIADIGRDTTELGGAIFLDVSDTWFEGHGPELAQRHKTKEGAYKKKVGIVLAVNREGQPLRWEVVAGRRNDSQTMGDMARGLRGIPWMKDLPLVFDRAMGKRKHLQGLTDAGIRFVTLLTREAFAGYAGRELDVPGVEEITVTDRDDAQAQATLLNALQSAGFNKLGRRLWAKDLGVRGHRSTRRRKADVMRDREAVQGNPPRRCPPHPRVMEAMRLAEEVTERMQQTRLRLDEIAQEMGLTRGKVVHLRKLMKLTEELRKLVREGGTAANLDQLEAIAALPHGEQPAAFAAHRIPELSEAETPVADAQAPRVEEPEGDPQLRLLLAVDPVAFTAARAKADAEDRELRELVEQLNAKLTDRRISVRSAMPKVQSLLEKFKVRDCYEATATRFCLTLQRNEEVWRRKRQTDGVRLFALHPEVDATPERVIDLYSAKMAVEVDFHVIKSTVQIRPVHHHTDAKVRAHVDLCVLALAIERALDKALPSGVTAPAALEQLETVRLTDVAPTPAAKTARVLTIPTPVQADILSHLNMRDLVDDVAL